ncbi:MAG: hypothetical protein IJN40_04185, partial [Clostridia bacterium]|nr:hypothetical protein [Clostridia bacterium]
RNVVNLTTFNKHDEPRYLNSQQARNALENGGALLYKFASDDDPDFIFTAAGDIATKETIEAIEEVEAMKNNPSLGKTYTNVDGMMKELLN